MSVPTSLNRLLAVMTLTLSVGTFNVRPSEIPVPPLYVVDHNPSSRGVSPTSHPPGAGNAPAQRRWSRRRGGALAPGILGEWSSGRPRSGRGLGTDGQPRRP